MTDEVTPALSAEEWKGRCFDDGTGFRVAQFTVGAIFLSHSRPDGNAEWSARLAQPSGAVHALAALCLYRQPFGFTQEDVTAQACKWLVSV